MRAALPCLGLCLALLAASSCAWLASDNSGGDFTVERERELTADVATQIRAGLKLVNDPVLLAYLNELGQEIVAVTEPQPFIYRFTLIEDDTLNAFTIGGGHVYINSGIFAQAGNVSELIGVLAHEIAHVRQRHAARRSEGQGLATLATLAALAAVALAGGDPALIAISQGVNVALQLKNSRSHEAEADREAITYMVRAGYDPTGITRFFERLVAAYPDPGTIPPYLYTHPAVKERIAATRVEMERIDAPRGLRRDDVVAMELGLADESNAPRTVTDSRLARMQARLAQLVSPVAGGSGLHARPEFDRRITEPLLDEASVERRAGRLDAADRVLAHAQQLEPNDPRIALARADLAEERGDWSTAAEHLAGAFERHPQGPLIQHRLGVAQARLGNRTRAIFYLELAAGGYRQGSAGQRRAEFEIQRITFGMLDGSALRAELDEPDRKRTRFRRGETLLWAAELKPRFQPMNPEFVLRWIAPDEAVAEQETLHADDRGRLSGRFDSANVRPGNWLLEILSEDARVDRLAFEIVPADGPPD